jgi:hypothetical protein
MTKFERIKKRLKEYWGFNLRRANPYDLGWREGSWRTGYIVSGHLRGYFCERFDTLAEIEQRWLAENGETRQ